MNTIAQNINNNKRAIATIIEEKMYLKPFEVRVLRDRARYAECLGRYKTAEEAMQVIEDISATPVTPYRFQKELSCY
jgi:hypothetical protein